MWKHFPCTLPNFEGCKGATGEPYCFLPCFFFIYFLDAKFQTLTALLLFAWNLIRHNFSNLGTFPRTPPNNNWKKKMWFIGASLIFVSGGRRDAGPVALVSAQESKVVVWTCHSVGSIFGPEKEGRDHISIRGSTFGSLLKYVCFAQGSKTGPSAFWIWCALGACLTSHSNTFLKRVVGIRPQTSASHIIATTSW